MASDVIEFPDDETAAKAIRAQIEHMETILRGAKRRGLRVTLKLSEAFFFAGHSQYGTAFDTIVAEIVRPIP